MMKRMRCEFIALLCGCITALCNCNCNSNFIEISINNKVLRRELQMYGLLYCQHCQQMLK
jgi:hypothetical protein